uniref:N-acetyltransferase domain-containing protein n=1 Tax=Plectus sambesii TaxID=2011161 RepID=A0A914UJN2_9BILA
MPLQIISATSAHAAEINTLLHELAAFEKLPEGPELSEGQIGEAIANKNLHGLLAYMDEELAGFALFDYSFCTWQGKYMFLHEIFVRPAHRKHGVGKGLWKSIAKLAHEQNLARIQLDVLDWNTDAIKFYKAFGAVDFTKEEGWRDFRVPRSEIAKFAAANPSAPV